MLRAGGDRIQSLRGRPAREGDGYRFVADDPGDEDSGVAVTLIAPENQRLIDNALYDVGGRVYRIPGQPPLMVATKVKLIPN